MASTVSGSRVPLGEPARRIRRRPVPAMRPDRRRRPASSDGMAADHGTTARADANAPAAALAPPARDGRRGGIDSSRARQPSSGCPTLRVDLQHLDTAVAPAAVLATWTTRSTRPRPGPGWQTAGDPSRRAGPSSPTATGHRSRCWRATSERPPSCPVLNATRRSSASAPRTSPTTIRSGRMRRAFRTRSRTDDDPATPPASSRTTWGWGRSSSAASSTVTMRSRPSISAATAFSRVVLPAPVPPTAIRFRRSRTAQRSSSSTPGGHRSASGERPDDEAADRDAGAVDGEGGTTRWTREPSANRASAVGRVRSTRSPSGPAIRSTASSTAPPVEHDIGALEAPRRSTHTGGPGRSP